MKCFVKGIGGALGMGKRFPVQKLQKEFNEITSLVYSWLDNTTKICKGGNQTQWTMIAPSEYFVPHYGRQFVIR